MSLSKNLAIVIGNVGQDPKVKETSSGKPMAMFSVATTKSWKKNDEWQEETTWHNIVCFGRYADTVEKKIHKGTRVFVQGRIQNRKWEDDDGKTRYSSSIFAEDIIVLTDRKSGGQESAADGDDLPPF
jgi:single-strand DNA-binding protein